MLRVLQTARLHEWEAVLVSPASERPPLLHALHVLTVQLLVVDLLAPSAVLPGNRFCATLLEALAAKLPHCPVNPQPHPNPNLNPNPNPTGAAADESGSRPSSER